LEGELGWKEVGDRSSYACGILEAQLRIHFSSFASSSGELLSNKRSLDPTVREKDFKSHNLQELDELISESKKENRLQILEISKIYETLRISEPNAQQNICGLKVEIHGLCYAYISFKPFNATPSIQMDKISLFGIHEKKESVHDISEFNIFCKISEHATEAMRFYSQNSPELDALRNLIVWLSYYGSAKTHLFSAPCKGCSKYLCDDSAQYRFLLPSFRMFDSGMPYHPQCLPSYSTSFK